MNTTNNATNNTLKNPLHSALHGPSSSGHNGNGHAHSNNGHNGHAHSNNGHNGHNGSRNGHHANGHAHNDHHPALLTDRLSQATVGRAIHHSGHGLHTGAPVDISIHPAIEDSGIVFVRTDITGQDNKIPARFDQVSRTDLCTEIANSAGVRVGTCEHLLAALSAQGIDNALIEVNGPEIPIDDGSAQPFVTLLERAGIQSQKNRKWVIELTKPIHVTHDRAAAFLLPATHQSFDISIDFQDKGGPVETFHYTPGRDSFSHELAPARTFCFLEDVAHMREHNLAMGGSLDNAIVFDQGNPINPSGLRFENECVRHKTMDVIGDLMLAQATILATYRGNRVGHHVTNALLHKLFASPQSFIKRRMEADDLMNETHKKHNLPGQTTTNAPASTSSHSEPISS